MDKKHLRTVSIIGEAGLEKLKNSTVAVFGIGGVGSYAVEALARSGIGKLYLYDNDTVSESNINRQLIALSDTVGIKKTELSAQRCRAINPEIEIIEKCEFVTPESDIPFEEFDFIVDAIDNVTAKFFLIEKAAEYGVQIISVMGTGNKLDPSLLQISDIYKTYECPLAKVMRVGLKKRNIKKLSVVWSPERPIAPENVGELRETGRVSPGSMVFVPSSAGILAASYVVRKIIDKY